MYEKQQADYTHFRDELQQNLSVISKRIDSRLFNTSPPVIEHNETPTPIVVASQANSTANLQQNLDILKRLQKLELVTNRLIV
jgi:hypothetical protein